MKKKALLSILSAALVASLAACGSSSSESSAAASSAAASSEAASEASSEAASEASSEASSAADASAAESGEGETLAEPVNIKIGASVTPHAEILNHAKDALAKKGVNIEVVEFTDYVLPNTAVEDGDLDANYFQHKPYMDEFNKEKGTHLVSVGVIHYEPFGIYAGASRQSLDQVQDGDKIAVPNDTTNEARALLLLEAQGLLKLKEGAGLTATKQDIVENPKNLDIVEIEAAQIPKSLDSVEYAVMNGNYALQADMTANDALAVEDAESIGAKTYGNVVAVKEGRENEPWVKILVDELHSKDMQDWMKEQYKGAVVPLNG